MTTQVRMGGMGGVVGFDWTALPVILEFGDHIVEEEDRPDLLRKLRALESYWVARVNRPTKKPAGKG